MSLHIKVDGVWVQAERPYVKRNGVWVAGTGAYVKRSGNWVQAYEYDVTPPNPPEITLSIHEERDGTKLQSRWIRVGVRLPGADDPDARLARVLTTYNGKPPTTQFGGTYTSERDKDWDEPWSEWRYNSYGPHKDTSNYAYKQWPRNATSGTIIAGDKDYFFTGWALDNSGNWSIANATKIHVPKASVETANVVVKEARFQANSSGSWRSTGYVAGDLVQQKSPRSVGLWFYGSQLTDSIGAQTTGDEKVSIRSAQIWIKRGDDTGAASANVYLFWTSYGSPGALPSPGSNLGKQETAKLGQLAKGEGKWFDLPASFHGDLNKNIKGMGLDWKDPVKADAFPNDFSQVVSTATNLRCGELHVVWSEEL